MKTLSLSLSLILLAIVLDGCGSAAPTPVEVISVHKAEAIEKNKLSIRVKTHERDADAQGNFAIGMINIARYAQQNGYTYFTFNNRPVQNQAGMPLTNTKDLMRYCWPQDFEEGDDFYEHKCQTKSKKSNNYRKVFKRGYTTGYRHTYSYSATLYNEEQYLFPTWSVESVLKDDFLKEVLKQAEENAGTQGVTEILTHDDNT